MQTLTVHVKLQGSLRDLLPAAQRGQAVLHLPAQTTVGEMLQHLRVNRAVLVVRNGQDAVKPDTQLVDGERFSVYAASAGG